MKTILSAVVAATLALIAIEAGAQATPGERQVSLTIETETLASALDKWAQQTGLQIFVQDWEATKKLPGRSLKGTFTAQDALEQLLSGTSLTYTWISDKAVSIRKKAVKTVPTALQRTSLEGQQGIPVAKFSGDDAGGAPSKRYSASGVSRGSDALRSRVDRVEEVIVTGTHIAGSANAGSRVLILDRDYIAKSGYATVDGLLKTVPQNFNGGVAQGQAFTLGDQTAGNFNQGAAVNLRGLGADSTLVLVDGRRQPAGGLYGAFVDISSIPTAAIERIEILPDGASALYGSDAVAGVVNFILRKDLDGAESQVRLGGAGGGADQLQVSQVFGRTWSTGSAIIGYQYDDRGNLQRSKRSYSASDDLTPFGGSDYRSTFSNPANILDPATFAPAFAIPTGQDGTSLQPGDLLAGVVNHDTSSSGMDLVGDQKIHSAFLNATQRFGDRFEVFASGRFARREHRLNTLPQTALLLVPSSNPFFVDPFGGSSFIPVTYNLSRDLGLPVSVGTVETYVGTVGAAVHLPADWELSFSGTHGKENTKAAGINAADTGVLDSALADPDPTTAFNPFGDGSNTSQSTLAAIRTTNRFFADATTRNANAILSGPLFRIGEADSKLAFGVDFRDEDVESDDQHGVVPPKSMGRRVKAAFAELALPLITSANHVALKDLGVSLAGRYEDYSDFGTTFDERIGISWVPVESVKVRATWGTSFKAPRLAQLVTRFPEEFAAFIPLESPDGFVDALVRGGNNPDLKEETADVWSAGLEWTPTAMPGFSASLSFWRIDYRDRVQPVGPTNNAFGILFEADEWTDAINFNPTPEQVADICRSPTFSFPGNPVSVDQCLASTPAAIVDLRLTNLARVTVEGIDMDSEYHFDTPAGTFSLGLNGVYTPSYDRQVTRNSQEVDVSNTTGNVLRLRLRGEVSWRRGGWDISTFVNYANSYKDAFSVSGRDIKAWTTVDATVSYGFEQSQAVLGGLTLALNALNIFDRDPPFANVGFFNSAYGYDTANADPLGRIVTLQVSKVW